MNVLHAVHFTNIKPLPYWLHFLSKTCILYLAKWTRSSELGNQVKNGGQWVSLVINLKIPVRYSVTKITEY